MRLGIAIAICILCVVPAGAVTLSGRVTDTNGGGVHPIDIDLRDSATDTLISVPGDTTDALGFYAMTVPSGTYNVSFNPAPGSHWFSETFPSVLVSENKTLNVTLVRGHYLSGRVVRQNGGQGVGMIDLDFASPSTGDRPDRLEDDLTDSLGYFQTLVDSATWDVGWIAPLAARLAPSRSLALPLQADVNVGELEMVDGFLIQGTVTDAGFFPVVDADLDVRLAGGNTKLWTPQDNTDQIGQYGIVVPAGLYDITISPPVGVQLAPVTSRSQGVFSDVSQPNVILPPAFELRGRCRNGVGQAISGIDVDVDSLPHNARLEISNDQTDAGGDFRVLVSAWDFRVTLSPPVSTKLLPVRLDSLHIAGATDLGALVFTAGHWVSGTVLEAGTGVPIPGANLDLRRLSTGSLAITPGDVSNSGGFFQITTDQDLYRLTVLPPSAAYDTLVIEPFRTLSDTVLTLTLTPRAVSVDTPSRALGLQLAAPWPNPSRGLLTVRFSAPGAVAELSILDVSGRRVAVLHRGSATAEAEVRWGGRTESGNLAAPGVYFLRLSAGQAVRTKRFVWMP